MPAIEAEQEPLILHLADHDPSGIDMTRDLEERLALFCEHHSGMAPTVHRIALNLNQVKALKLPPNPAKLTDSRAKKYIEQFGDQSWELDALPPEYLADLVEAHVRKYVDHATWGRRLAEIDAKRTRLRQVAARWR